MTLTYILQVNLFAMLLLLIVYLSMRAKKEEPSVTKRIFVTLVVINLLLLLFDMSIDLINYISSPTLILPAYVIATALYILIPVPGFLWMLYIEYFIFKDLRRLRQWHKFFIIPLYINILLLIVNLFAPMYFFISDAGIYERGPMFLALSALAYTYLIIAFIHTLRYRKQFRKRDFVPLMLFAIPVAIGGIIQLLFFGLLTVWTTLALSILMIYLFIQSRIIQSDYLTGLYNRREFDIKISDLSKKNLKHTNLALLLMDIDRFKSINDKYGHPMGDLALQAFSNILRKNFRMDDFVARLGGDEFGVLLEIEQKDDITKVIQRLKSSIQDYNNNNQLPFELDFSFGVGIYEGDKDLSFNDFIKQVDDNMYVQKHKKKKDAPRTYDPGNNY